MGMIADAEHRASMLNCTIWVKQLDADDRVPLVGDNRVHHPTQPEQILTGTLLLIDSTYSLAACRISCPIRAFCRGEPSASEAHADVSNEFNALLRRIAPKE
jgi:hypothetical protein